MKTGTGDRMGYTPKAYADANGPIPFDNRLSPKKPFLLGGEYSLANLRPLPWEKNLEFKSEIYRQTTVSPKGRTLRSVRNDSNSGKE